MWSIIEGCGDLCASLRDSNMSLLSYFVAHIKIANDDKDVVDNEDSNTVDILD